MSSGERYKYSSSENVSGEARASRARAGKVRSGARGRIMMVTTALNRGGTELHLASLIPRLIQEGFDISVSAISGGGPIAKTLRDDGIRLVLPEGQKADMPVKRSYQGRPIAGVRALVRDLKQRPVDILHSFLPLGYLAGSLASYLSNTPKHIMSRRSENAYQNRYPGIARLEKFLHGRAHYLLGNSKRVVRDLMAEGAPGRKVGLLYNGVKFSAFQGAFDRDEERRSLDISGDALVMIMVANLISYKGHIDLLDGLNQIKDKLPDGWVLQIVGRDDGLGAGFQTHARGLGINDHIRWVGASTDVARLLRVSDIGVLVSHEEGFSNVVLEGLASGLAMVVSDVGGNGEAVLDGEQGIVVAAHAPDQIAAAILKLVENPDLREKFGRSGQIRAQEFFSLEACVENYCRLYDAVLAGQTPPFGIEQMADCHDLHNQPKPG